MTYLDNLTNKELVQYADIKTDLENVLIDRLDTENKLSESYNKHYKRIDPDHFDDTRIDSLFDECIDEGLLGLLSRLDIDYTKEHSDIFLKHLKPLIQDMKILSDQHSELLEFAEKIVDR